MIMNKFMTYKYVSDYSVVTFTVPGNKAWGEVEFDAVAKDDLESYVTSPKDYHLDDSWEGKVFDGVA